MSPTFEKVDLQFSDWGKILNTFEDRTLFQTSDWLAFEELNCVHVEIMDRNVSVDDARELGFEMREFKGFEIDLFIPSISIPMFGNPFPDC